VTSILTNALQYHDDGEKSLGPNIAAWSLGCPAMMNVRMKFKYYSGFSKDRKKYRTDLPILPGCFKPEVRRELNLMRGLTEKALTKKAKELLKGVPSSPPAILKMKLRHGDFMSMHGADMQLYYEVCYSVICYNKCP